MRSRISLSAADNSSKTTPLGCTAVLSWRHMSHLYKHTMLFLVIAISACGTAGESEAYTLYRDSTVSGVHRIHVASFDASSGEQYNRENCQVAGDLFQQQPGTKTKFWCEKGRFRK